MANDNPKDIIGNELHEGTWVAVKFDGLLVGKIVKVQSGGIIHPGQKNMQTAGVVVMGFEMRVPFAPGQFILNVVKTTDPQAEEKINAVLAEENKKPGPRLA